MVSTTDNDTELKDLLWRKGLTNDLPLGKDAKAPRSKPEKSNHRSGFPRQPMPKGFWHWSAQENGSRTGSALRRPDVIVKQESNPSTKRASEAPGFASNKRLCGPEREPHRLSPIARKPENVGSSRMSSPSMGGGFLHAPSEQLSANFTKLLEEQQKQNAKQSIRIAELEEAVRAKDAALEQRAETLRQSNEALSWTQRFEQQAHLLGERITELGKKVAARDAELEV